MRRKGKVRGRAKEGVGIYLEQRQYAEAACEVSERAAVGERAQQALEGSVGEHSVWRGRGGKGCPQSLLRRKLVPCCESLMAFPVKPQHAWLCSCCR